MAYTGSQRAFVEQRSEDRDEVQFRARASGPDNRALSLLVVNLSPNGMMARCEDAFAPGDRLRVTLPVVGAMSAEVRWALGGRIGCQFESGIDRATYRELLATVMQR
ncbi:PilZ domain-containing protein [Sphingomonas sp. IW22]|uniref:PilZ domain-containing protein n=1 Tax=Sphingomonas sp. IW22 TaxID=3242489 RepID=UPI0035225343